MSAGPPSSRRPGRSLAGRSPTGTTPSWSPFAGQAETGGSLARMLAFEVPGVIGEMAPALGIGLATRNPAAIGAYVPIINGHYIEAALKEGLSMRQATRKANAFTLIETGTELIPFAAFLKMTDGTKFRILRKALEGSAYEGAQEALVESLEMAWDAGFYDEGVSVREALGRLGHAFVLGATVGGIVGGGIAAGETAAESARKPPDRPPGKPQEAISPERVAEGVLKAKTTEDAIEAATVAAGQRTETDEAEEAPKDEDRRLADAIGAYASLVKAHLADPTQVSRESVDEARREAEARGASREDLLETDPGAGPLSRGFRAGGGGSGGSGSFRTGTPGSLLGGG